MDMNQMMQQAQKMQLELARAQEEVAAMTFTATSGGGMIEAVANGAGELESLTINPEAVDPDDVEMLQDMVLAAVNEALRGVSKAGEERMAAATGIGGLGGPGGMPDLSDLSGLAGLFS